MKKIRFTRHLQSKILVRNISKDIVIGIVKRPDKTYFDSLNKTNIAIKQIGKKYYMVAYSVAKNSINVITIHPIKYSQIKNRLSSGRWAFL